eukprot:CAMPEP_0197568950 /NCGR_PEP_ID=MMETSP1320-20131121/38176_1 /TAXON_ID=91990 /ORGANISM="Bolidomonas sp., Strain RCC2347" /LENGTH=55 /DNA_ID=CAMNT_0043131257 /DNA_START=92 /DNA_END=256 /DNA_ORIENTATION=+
MSLGYSTLSSLLNDSLLTLITPPSSTPLNDLLESVGVTREEFDDVCRSDTTSGLG